jgi:hypothetical protein
MNFSMNLTRCTPDHCPKGMISTPASSLPGELAPEVSDRGPFRECASANGQVSISPALAWMSTRTATTSSPAPLPRRWEIRRRASPGLSSGYASVTETTVAGEGWALGTCTGHVFAGRRDTIRADFGDRGVVEADFTGGKRISGRKRPNGSLLPGRGLYWPLGRCACC